MDPVEKSQRKRQEARYFLHLAKHLVSHGILLILPAPSKGLGKCGQRDTMAEVDTNRVRKGKNFTSEEDRQLCRSFLAISQDPIQGNG
jgi:hypothetical protein